MPQIHLCFLWHMHQPYYKDLASGEYKLPWTRMHALKDYYGMTHLLEEFPQIRQTFNLVPSMMAQVEEYASGRAADPFLQAGAEPGGKPERRPQKAFLLRHSFYSDPQRMIYRYPRYGELYDAWQAQKSSGSRSMFGPQEFRDLQMWSQLAWFDEDFRRPRIRKFANGSERGRFFSVADQHRMGEKQREILNLVLPEYRKLAHERPDRNLDHAVLPSDSAPGLRFQYRFRGPSGRAPAAAVSLSAGCAAATGALTGILHGPFRNGARGSVALGRVGFR